MDYNVIISLTSGDVKEMQVTANTKKEATRSAHIYMNMHNKKGRIVSIKEVK